MIQKKFDLAECIPGRLFITGIGTDVGKSYATGWLARELMRAGKRVITQKFIQTGCTGFSEDISVHRRIMGVKPLADDLCGITAPLILSYPSSPDLAARIDGVTVDFEEAARATEVLASRYDHVLVEGAGGVMVPLKDRYLTIDYIAEHALPAAVVTNGKLGSVSDTLLTLTALRHRGIGVPLLIYNSYFDEDAVICADTKRYLREWLAAEMPDASFVDMMV